MMSGFSVMASCVQPVVEGSERPVVSTLQDHSRGVG